MAGSKKKRDRLQRSRAFVSSQEAIGTVCAAVADGGSLRDFCLSQDFPFNFIADWIAADAERAVQYKEALGWRDAHNKDVVTDRLVTISTVDIAEAYDKNNCLLPVHLMPERIRQSIAWIKVTELWQGTGDERRQIGATTEIKLWDRNKSVETLARSLKMLTDKVDVDGKLSLEDLVAGASSASRDSYDVI